MAVNLLIGDSVPLIANIQVNLRRTFPARLPVSSLAGYYIIKLCDSNIPKMSWVLRIPLRHALLRGINLRIPLLR